MSKSKFQVGGKKPRGHNALFKEEKNVLGDQMDKIERQVRKSNSILTDNSIMPFGKHKGLKMKDVPNSYLIWVFDNNHCSKQVAKYVSDRYDKLKK